MAKPSAKAEVQEVATVRRGPFGMARIPNSLESKLAFYPCKRPKRILDATINGGRFWRGSQRPVLGLDIEILQQPDIVADNAAMPFRNEVFDVVVYDPPHIPNQGKDNEEDFNVRFWTGAALVERKPVHIHTHVPAFRP